MLARSVLAVTLALAGGAAAGCAPGDRAASEPRPAPSAAPVPAPTPAEALEAFARDNGLEHLPRATVTIGAGEGSGEGSGELGGGAAGAEAEPLTLQVVVADTDATRRRGLMGVPEVPAGVGMLFAYADDPGPGGRPGFWMLDTVVALDIVFASEGRVVGVATMVPCAAQPCPVTHPGVGYDVAVEVAAGTIAAAGVGPGDPLRWERTGPVG